MTMFVLAPAAFAEDCADEETGSCRFVPEASKECDGCTSMLQRASRSHVVARLPQKMRPGPNGVQSKHRRTDNGDALLHDARDASSRVAPGPSQLAGERDSSKKASDSSDLARLTPIEERPRGALPGPAAAEADMPSNNQSEESATPEEASHVNGGSPLNR